MIFIRLPLIFASGAQMELRHLRYFVTLAEELHFTRAAERLNIAPPTLTVQIQEIERTLSARLFVRTKRPRPSRSSDLRVSRVEDGQGEDEDEPAKP
jgi:hypothetical protein